MILLQPHLICGCTTIGGRREEKKAGTSMGLQRDREKVKQVVASLILWGCTSTTGIAEKKVVPENWEMRRIQFHFFSSFFFLSADRLSM